jgi:hypothetical protein
MLYDAFRSSNRTFYALLISPMHATFPFNLIILDFVTLLFGVPGVSVCVGGGGRPRVPAFDVWACIKDNQNTQHTRDKI